MRDGTGTTLERMDPVTRQQVVRAALGEGDYPADRVMADPDRHRGAAWIVAIPGLARQFGRVPGAYVRALDGGWCVACPCGRRPIIGPGELVTCRRARAWVPTRAGCARVFVGARTGVLVYSEPHD